MASDGCAGTPEATMEHFPLHVEGFCEPLHLTSDGLLSAGADGKLVKVVAKPEAPPERAWAHRLCERDVLGAAAISGDGTWLATGQETDAGFGVWVCALDPQTGHRPVAIPRLAARFTLPARHLAWRGPLLGIATDDGRLCVWDREADSSGDSRRPRRRDFPVGNNSGGVRGLAFDPRGELLAGALSNGALVVFGLQDGKERHRSQLWPKAVPGSERLVMAWRPDGEELALPGEPAVRVASRGDYSTTSLEGGHRLPVAVAAWGQLLATASEDAVCLWQPPQLMLTCRPKQQPYSLSWAGESFLVIGMAAGSWARLAPPPPPEAPPAQAAPGADAGETEHASAGANAPEADAAKPSGFSAGTAGADSTEAAAAVVDPTASEAEKPPPTAVKQQPFQPGATSKELRRFYLAWNDHGTLKCSLSSSAAPGSDEKIRRNSSSRSVGGRSDHSSWSGTGRVVVDYSRERGPTSVRELRAPEGLVHGSIGPGVCALSAAGQCRRPESLVVHMANPWSRDRTSFKHILPVGETVEALVVSRHFVAAFTSPLRYLRVHTLTGVPLSVLSLSGDVVCMAASDDLLLCVTSAPGHQGPEPYLEYDLFGVSAKERLATGGLPLSPASTLRWIGFSAEALPLALDSAGVLRALALSGGTPLLAPAAGQWLPVADLPEGGARLWPVRAERGALHCAELQKAGGEPRVGPLHKLQEVRFSLPLGGEELVAEKVLQGLLSEHLKFAIESGILPSRARQARTNKRKQGLADDQSALRVRAY
uniref:WDHD1/CFT4 second beta-propeller domain-containing protein n=1 Tax=Alexandrium monilatum TaxID=311494 RepID=A0A7S4UEX7_9DINO